MQNLDVWYARLDVESLLADLAKVADKKQMKAVHKNVKKAHKKNSMKAFDRLVRVVDGEPEIISDPPLLVPARELVSKDQRHELEERIQVMLGRYRESLKGDRRHLFDSYRFVEMARKVVGVGSVGTRAWVLLMMGRDGQDPLFMQAKEAEASVLEPYVGASEFENHGERVVEGQWLMQAASDILLGWLPANGIDDQERDFYVRQLWDGKRSADVETMPPEGLAIYGRVCGWTLARAHARSGDRIAIASYLGKGETFDQAIADFSELYADQNELDYARARRRGQVGPDRGGDGPRLRGAGAAGSPGGGSAGDREWRSSAGACGGSEREPDSEEGRKRARHGRRTVTMQHSPRRGRGPLGPREAAQ